MSLVPDKNNLLKDNDLMDFKIKDIFKDNFMN